MDLFRKSAGYRYLDAFVLANVVELGTGHFCERFLTLRNDPGGRTYSQMTHAARSGCRNFAEGSERLMTSYATATELLDVARASLCELRDDYLKWLMMQGLAPWAMESPEAQRIYGVRLTRRTTATTSTAASACTCWRSPGSSSQSSPRRTPTCARTRS
jgi:hypothetical protein